jgi:hypothetical protein
MLKPLAPSKAGDLHVEYDEHRYRISKKLPLLAGAYNSNSLMTLVANFFDELLWSACLPQIEAIEKRKKLSSDESPKDKDVLKLLAQRDREQVRLFRGVADVLMSRKLGRRAETSEEVRAKFYLAANALERSKQKVIWKNLAIQMNMGGGSDKRSKGDTARKLAVRHDITLSEIKKRK